MATTVEATSGVETNDFAPRFASPHWTWTTHASNALSRGAELVTVRDDLRHASITTTSFYLLGDEVRRVRQLDQPFGES